MPAASRASPAAWYEGIIRVESGGNPWALRVGIGKGYSFYPKSRGEGWRLLAVSLALTDNVDIGLMQVNWRTWRKTVRSLGLNAYDLLDAQTNLKMGCRILTQALATAGSFEARLGRYHSPAPGAWVAGTPVRVLAAAREARSGEAAVMPLAEMSNFRLELTHRGLS